MKLNEEIKSSFSKSGASRLLLVLIADLLMTLRYIVVEISIQFVFFLEAKIVSIV